MPRCTHTQNFDCLTMVLITARYEVVENYLHVAPCNKVIQDSLGFWIPGMDPGTLGTRGFSRVRREISVLAEGRHVFGRRPKPRAAKTREKPLARSGAFYRPR